MIDAVGRLITLLGYAAKIADADAGGLSATPGSVNYNVETVEHHLHVWERWFGAAVTPDGEVHVADRVGTSVTAFQADAGNDAWGSWLQVLGSTDTPADAGNAYFDFHRILVTAVERNNATHFFQIALGASGAAALSAGTYTEFVFKPQTVQAEEWPIWIMTNRVAVGTKAWLRVFVPGQDSGTADLFLGLHEYDG